jgi:hypothetical protein
MKLYTEEQAKYFFECGRNFQMNSEITFKIAQEETTPIELPSDDEIEREANINLRVRAVYLGYILGAKWMRDKIQGGNK